jgi:hypothetical protein
MFWVKIMKLIIRKPKNRQRKRRLEGQKFPMIRKVKKQLKI